MLPVLREARGRDSRGPVHRLHSGRAPIPRSMKKSQMGLRIFQSQNGAPLPKTASKMYEKKVAPAKYIAAVLIRVLIRINTARDHPCINTY